MGSRVAIREATSADAESIADVHADSIRDGGSDAYDDRQVRAWLANIHPERYPLEESGFRIVVAENEDDGIVGFGLLDLEPSGRDDETTGEVGAVYVHPDHTHEGVGSAILEALESAARDTAIETLALTASRNAVEFYERHGYDGVETVALEMREDVSLECLQMRKRLGPE